jgi:hypothetical protein
LRSSLNYRRLEDRNERRRARVVAAGTVALIVAVLPYVVMLYPGVAGRGWNLF